MNVEDEDLRALREAAADYFNAQEKTPKKYIKCPHCNSDFPKDIRSPRYTNYLCDSCVAKATDSQGRPVKLFNASMSGGFLAKYDDGSPAEQVSNDHIVYIDGNKYSANEAYMGGIVVYKS